MIYGSVCSGIEAATVAWHSLPGASDAHSASAPLGWRPSFFSEIDAFPRAVLAHHYPNVPLHGDFTTIREGQYAAIDVLVGGTPCQSFSVAGFRAGLDDERGNLALEFCKLARRLRPRWVVWENVPGVLSVDGGRAFASILGGLAECGYGLAYRVLDAQFVRVDGFGRAVPQRRRRVFVVGHLGGNWQRAAAVLFERASMQGDLAPRREAREDVALSIDASAARRRGSGMNPNQMVPEVAPTLRSGGNATGGNRPYGTDVDTCDSLIVAKCLNAHGGDRYDYETETLGAHSKSESETFIAEPIAFDETQITSPNNRCNPQSGDPCHPLARGARPPTIAFNARQDPDVFDGFSGPLNTDGSTQALLTGWRVRRLTPVECERLQGFPDGYTAIPYRSKPAADGPRYKALGNSMAVNVMRWIGRRIEMVEALP